jgi:hypothetical protein
MKRALIALALVGLLTIGPRLATPTRADGVSLSGSGEIRSADGGASFSVELDDEHPLSFTFSDRSTSPPRVVALNQVGAIDCLGELFGGQTVRVTVIGSDSQAQSQNLAIQLYLVDGGSGAPDQISLKVSQPDGTVVFFAPLRTLSSGDLTLRCG